MSWPSLTPNLVSALFVSRSQRHKGARKKGSVDIPNNIECLPELMAVCEKNREFLHSCLGDEMPHNHIDQVGCAKPFLFQYSETVK
jgi:hypothetical protein